MRLSLISIQRPVLAIVASLIVTVLGLFSLDRMPVREFPGFDQPIVNVNASYPGASAEIVERQVTQVLEDAIGAVPGVESVRSNSGPGGVQITIEFRAGRNVDAAASDVRDQISRFENRLPRGIDPPFISKADSNQRPIMWISLYSDNHSQMELSDYAQRYIVDRLGNQPGVAFAFINGERKPSMRLWLDRDAMAARGVTVSDIDEALRRENVDAPGGWITSKDRELVVRTDGGLKKPGEFARVVIGERGGELVRIGDIAKVEVGPEGNRNMVRANGRDAIAMGIVRQSDGNALESGEAVRRELAAIEKTLPKGMVLDVNLDQSTYIRAALSEVRLTIIIAVALVVAVVFMFLGSVRATMVPAVAIPVSLLGAVAVLNFLGYSINVLTLLAMVLAVGLVVDDAIIVMENAQRRIDEGEPPLLAAAEGVKQIGFAVMATTAVLLTVFLPILFVPGNMGRLFTEFAITMAAGVAVSGFVALTLTPMMCSAILRPAKGDQGLHGAINRVLDRVRERYRAILSRTLTRKALAPVMVAVIAAAMAGLYMLVPKEFAPREDRATFILFFNAPKGSTIEYTAAQALKIEKLLEPLYKEGRVARYLGFAGGFSARSGSTDSGNFAVRMPPWNERDFKQFEVGNQLRPKLAQIPGVRSFIVNPVGLNLAQGAFGPPVQIVLSGPTYEDLAKWTQAVLPDLRANQGLADVDADFTASTPQLNIELDRERMGDLGVSTEEVSSTIQAFMGGRQTGDFEMGGRKYPILMQAQAEGRINPSDLSNIFVRGRAPGTLVPLAGLVTLKDTAGPDNLTRIERMRSVVINASLVPGYPLGQAVSDVEAVMRAKLPPEARVSWQGDAREFLRSSSSVGMIFGLALILVFLVLAAQFESFVHPTVVMLTVPLALTGALGALYITGQSLNVFSQIGIVMLVGIVAKNGILIVEFANQLREEGRNVRDAVLEASALRLRPILMTSIATVAGALPLILSGGAGSENRTAIGVVVVGGTLFGTFLTLFVVPSFYALVSGWTRPAGEISRRLAGLTAAAGGLKPSPAE